ncbi:MAG: DMT family transporter, partial [Chloroflexi bacterium]|nr:DMT family transporter [Chloroflexota bacterium]
GLAPVLGKQAIAAGYSPMAVVAFRTSLAAILLFLIFLFFNRSYLYIYPAGLLGCGLAGAINGLGSLLFYMSLGTLDASIGSLLYSLYPVFLVGWLLLDRQPPSRITLLRVALATLGVVLLTVAAPGGVSWIGVCLMLLASALYALHLPVNQHVLYDIPSPTVTFYTLLAMSIVVLPAYFLFDRQFPAIGAPLWPVLALTMVTFLSRLTLFAGVKKLGGMQTALLGLSELFVTILVSHLWLGEAMDAIQWVGAALLGASLVLVGLDRIGAERPRSPGGWLSWLRSRNSAPGITWGPHD